MKKLLLTLGTVAAVAAPVASVIACGSTKATAVTKDSLISVLKDRGYSFKNTADADAEKILKELQENAKEGDKASFTFGKIVSGQSVDDRHGTVNASNDSDDFLIIVNGGSANAKAAADAAKATATAVKDATLDFTPAPAGTAGNFATHWGTFTAADFKDATSIIYLHHWEKGTAGESITINGVYTDADGKVHEVPDVTPSAVEVTYAAPTK